MSDKSHENNFKFGVYQNDSPIIERIFSADVFNPVIRYSVDIRDMIPTISAKLQKTLSKRNISTLYERGYLHKGDNVGNVYDLIALYKSTLDGKVDGYENKLSRPSIVTHTINKKTISGVECKFGLYINDNPIVERNIYVDGYNPASRFSIDMVEVVNEIVEDIISHLKANDVAHMWSDYDLINTYGIYIHQIRDLSKDLRIKMIKNIKNDSYVKTMKSHFRRQFQQNKN
jgi:hypothetical protein